MAGKESEVSRVAGEPQVVLTGERVCLGPVRKDLIPVYQRWINDPEVNLFLTLWGTVLSLEDEEKWYEGINSRTDRIFTVYHRESMVPIGNTGLHRVDFRHGSAELGIVLGEKEYWGQGLGTEAVRLVVDFGLTALGLNSIRLRVLEHNLRAVRCYEKAGFRTAGRFRQAMKVGSRLYDEVLMDVVASEFVSPVLGGILKQRGLPE